MGPCCFLKVGGAGVGAFGTPDLVPFTEDIYPSVGDLKECLSVSPTASF